MSKRVPVALLSIDVKTVHGRLMKAEIGDVVTYNELSEIIGRDIRNDARPVLYSAIRKALNDNGAVFESVRNVGVKRLNDQEVVCTGESSTRKTHRAAVRGLKKLALGVKDYVALPQELKVRHNAYASVLSAIEHITKAPQMKKIEQRVEQAQVALPVAKTLEAFQR